MGVAVVLSNVSVSFNLAPPRDDSPLWIVISVCGERVSLLTGYQLASAQLVTTCVLLGFCIQKTHGHVRGSLVPLRVQELFQSVAEALAAKAAQTAHPRPPGLPAITAHPPLASPRRFPLTPPPPFPGPPPSNRPTHT